MIRATVFKCHLPNTIQVSRAEYKTLKIANAAVLLVTAVLLTGPRFVYAQSPQADEQQQAGQQQAPQEIEQVVVSGTRLGRTSGFEAPTPVTVVGAEQLDTFASTNIADMVNTLPVFLGSDTPSTSISNGSRGDANMNVLNLRDLGTKRTLVLLDGRRIVPSAVWGDIDVNNVPQSLVSRVEIVTGGASAVYGSGAVGGVANFILDEDFTGLKGSLSGGVTSYGDRQTSKVSLTAGTDFAAGRGHIILSGSTRSADGIPINDRPWNLEGWQFMRNPNYTPTSGQPDFLLLNHVAIADGIRGGIITDTALKGTAFGPGGEPFQFNYGDLVFYPDMHGGDWKYSDVRGRRAGESLAPDMSGQEFFTHANFQLTDDVELFAEFGFNRSSSYNWAYSISDNGTITVQRDNPFIPEEVATRMDTLGVTQFHMGSMHTDLGIIATDADRRVYRYVVGANGLFEAFDSNWDWDVYYQKGIADNYNIVDHNIVWSDYQRSLDAVSDPGTGAPVCRSTLTDPGNGCVPYNPFGIGVNSQAVVDYLEGGGLRTWRDENINLDVLSATITGEPFSNWAGPVSVALGLEYREDSVSGTNDPISDYGGWFTGGLEVTDGSIDVTEGYFETVVPLARDVSWAESLDLNAAVRQADYSTAGALTVWKVGATYTPVDDITFRLTRSRDARAPYLEGLYSSGGGALLLIANPWDGNQSENVATSSHGNLGLKPEIADAIGAGIVLRPRFLPEFSASIDYWDVDIDNAIGRSDGQDIVDRCFAGNQSFCDSIVFTPGAGMSDIATINVSVFNFIIETARGLDLEAAYQMPIWGGDLSARVLATHYIERTTSDGITEPEDIAGTNSEGGGVPSWIWNASLSYARDAIDVTLRARGVSSGVYDNRWIECQTDCPPSTPEHRTTNVNHIDSQAYLDASFSYLLELGHTDVNLFLNVRNVFNSDPALVADGPGGFAYTYGPANQSLYDWMGRVYLAGARFKF